MHPIETTEGLEKKEEMMSEKQTVICSMQFYFSRKKALFEILVLQKPNRNIALEYNDML
jgi:hypothetical protein